MDESSSILQLEAVVEKLIANYQQLQQERDGLVGDLANRAEEINTLQAELNQLQSEREDVHGRVSSLLGKLVDWENSQVLPGSGEIKSEGAGEQPKTVTDAPAKLFSMEG